MRADWVGADLRSEMSRRLAHEEGVALPLTLMVLVILSLTVAALLIAGAVNQRTTLVSAQGKESFALAQQGLADAEGVLYGANSQSDDACGSTCVPSATVTTSTGTIVYSGTLASGTWTLTGTGTVGNVSRTVTAQATAGSSSTTTNPAIWNYLYVNNPSSCLTLQGGSQIKVPLYTPGNVCITGGSSFTGSTLDVGGYLSVPDSGSSIGSSGSKITQLEVTGSCSQQKSGKYWTCNGSGPTIWANSATIGSALSPSLSMPSDNIATDYAAQTAGTTSGCGTLLDNDTTLNDSDGTVNLFPTNSSYDCKVFSAGGSTIGEIKWNAVGSWSVGTFSVSGVVVVDGNLDLSGGMHVEYTGGGTIVFDGTVTVEGGTSICGGGSGSNDCTGWDPGDWNNSAKATQCASSGGCNVLVLVADCKADTISGTCFHVTGGTTLQAGAYANGLFTLDGGSVDQGPVLSQDMSISGGTNITQMLPFNNLPSGVPAPTSTVYSPPGTVKNWNG